GEVTGLTSKKIVDRMIVADSLQIEIAQVAASKTKNPAVREFATQLASGHRTHLDELRKLAASPEVGREPGGDTAQPSHARALEQLRQAPADTSFDRAFVTQQVQMNQAAVDNLKKWRSAASNAALQQSIDHSISLFEGDLARAQLVAGKLGAP